MTRRGGLRHNFGRPDRPIIRQFKHAIIKRMTENSYQKEPDTRLKDGGSYLFSDCLLAAAELLEAAQAEVEMWRRDAGEWERLSLRAIKALSLHAPPDPAVPEAKK